MEVFLRTVFAKSEHNEEEAGLRETETALRSVLEQGRPVELSPQNRYVRRLQHQLAERYGLTTESKGAEPHRRVVIYPVR
jgi:predicted RNA-binding protein Jag